MLKSELQATGKVPFSVRAYKVGGELFYNGDDLAKALGFAGASTALAACDPVSNGENFIAWIVLCRDSVLTILNETGKNALLDWGREHGWSHQELNIELNVLVEEKI